MENGTYTTKCQTADGRVYDLGRRESPPHHPECKTTTCAGCLVQNAWTERRGR